MFVVARRPGEESTVRRDGRRREQWTSVRLICATGHADPVRQTVDSTDPGALNANVGNADLNSAARARAWLQVAALAYLSRDFASSRPDPEDHWSTRHSPCVKRAAGEHRDKIGCIDLAGDRHVGAEAGVDQLTSR